MHIWRTCISKSAIQRGERPVAPLHAATPGAFWRLRPLGCGACRLGCGACRMAFSSRVLRFASWSCRASRLGVFRPVWAAGSADAVASYADAVTPRVYSPYTWLFIVRTHGLGCACGRGSQGYPRFAPHQCGDALAAVGSEFCHTPHLRLLPWSPACC